MCTARPRQPESLPVYRILLHSRAVCTLGPAGDLDPPRTGRAKPVRVSDCGKCGGWLTGAGSATLGRCTNEVQIPPVRSASARRMRTHLFPATSCLKFMMAATNWRTSVTRNVDRRPSECPVHLGKVRPASSASVAKALARCSTQSYGSDLRCQRSYGPRSISSTPAATGGGISCSTSLSMRPPGGTLRCKPGLPVPMPRVQALITAS
eukprot:COSAG06_NODE_586_length_14002_cov_11.579228_13_plen_208_part_00